MLARDDPAIRIEPLEEADVPAVVRLAQRIWRRCYRHIISSEQIEYMLAQRYDAQHVVAQLRQGPGWWDKMTIAGELVAFAASAPGRAPAEVKLEQLYVREDLHGRGLGSRLIAHLEGRARAAGCARLHLQVNRHNARAIEAYRRNGFQVVDAKQFDIGGGFVMDDYIMVKELCSA